MATTRASTAFRAFFAAIFTKLFTAMSGPLSVPAAISAYFVENRIAQGLLGATAFVCAWAAAYAVWKVQYDKANALEKELTRLELDIQFDPENIEECSLDEGKGWKQFRLNIKNGSGNTIHDCHGEIDKIESPLLARSWPEKAPLTWAYLIDITKLDLHSGECKQLNVIRINDQENGRSATVQFISPANANNPVPPFEKLGQYECSLLVAAEEINAKTVRFVFDWTGDSKTSRIRNVRIT